MTERTRNLAVGLTVLAAFAMLGGMILLFAGAPGFFQTGFVIHIHTDSTHDVHPGDPVYMTGIQIGHFTDVNFSDPDDPSKGVLFTARLNPSGRVPGNVKCHIFTGGQFRGALAELRPEGDDALDPVSQKPLKSLPGKAPVTLEAVIEYQSLIQLPPDVTKALDGLGKLVNNLNAMIEAPPPAPAGTGPAASQGTTTAATAPVIPGGLPGAVVRLNRTLDALYAVMGSSDNQANIHSSLANLSKATAGAVEAMDAIKKFASDAEKLSASADKTLANFSNLSTRASDDLHTLTGKLITDAEDLSKIMMTLNKAAMKIDQGEGTVGKLVNDPALYNNLTEMSKGLDKLVKDLDALVKQWKDKGVEMKIK